MLLGDDDDDKVMMMSAATDNSGVDDEGNWPSSAGETNWNFD